MSDVAKPRQSIALWRTMVALQASWDVLSTFDESESDRIILAKAWRALKITRRQWLAARNREERARRQQYREHRQRITVPEPAVAARATVIEVDAEDEDRSDVEIPVPKWRDAESVPCQSCCSLGGADPPWSWAWAQMTPFSDMQETR